MTIWVLFHETNSGHCEESDGYIEAVYATEELAEAARLAAIRAAIAEGHSVWFNPDDPDEEGEADWEHDWHVEAHVVREEATLPTEGFFDFLARKAPESRTENWRPQQFRGNVK